MALAPLVLHINHLPLKMIVTKHESKKNNLALISPKKFISYNVTSNWTLLKGAPRGGGERSTSPQASHCQGGPGSIKFNDVIVNDTQFNNDSEKPNRQICPRLPTLSCKPCALIKQCTYQFLFITRFLF